MIQVWESLPARGLDRVTLTEAYVWDIRDLNRTLDAYGAFHDASFTLTGGDTPQRVSGGLVSVGFFRALGVVPTVGRLFAPGEDDPGAPGDLALLSHDLWTSRFGADPAIVGRPNPARRARVSVVGILPASTPWLDAADVFVPFVRRVNASRTSWEYTTVGRLKPGVSLEAAAGDLNRSHASWRRATQQRTKAPKSPLHRRASGSRATACAAPCGHCWARSACCW